MTGPKRDTDKKTQFGKDAKSEGEAKTQSRVMDDGRQASKVLERPRSSALKYTGSFNPKLLSVGTGTGEFAKAIAAKAEAREALYDRIASEEAEKAPKQGKLSAEFKRDRKLSVQVPKPPLSNQPVSKSTGEQKKGIEEHKKPSAEGLEKLRAQSLAAEPVEPVEYLSANGAPAKVQYPDGSVRHFRFDRSGELAQVRYEDPASGRKENWVHLPGGDWEQRGANNERVSLFQGHVSVDQQGNLTFVVPGENTATVESVDGKRWTFFKDGLSIAEDKNGKIEEVNYPNDSQAFMLYDDRGELCQIQFPDGVTWQKAEEDNWLAIDEQGVPIDPAVHFFFGQIEVIKDGSIWMTDTTGNTASVNPDGSRTTLYNDGSIVDMTPEGLVLRVVYPSPKESNIEFKYQDGKLVAIDHGNGSCWEKVKANSWINRNTGENWAGEVVVNIDGSYTAKEAGEEARSTENTNGSRMLHLADGSARVENPDGSSVVVDKTGHITGIDYPQGQKRQFSYKNSVLIEVRYEDPDLNFKDTWRKQGENWVQYQEGKATGKSWAGEINVDQASVEFVYQSAGSNELAVEKVDGSVLTVTEEGVKDIRYAEGDERTFSRNSNGVVVGFTEQDAEWKSADGHHWSDEKGNKRTGTAHVGEDGTFSFREKAKTRYEFTSGVIMERTADGARRIFDKRHQLIHTVDTKKTVFKFCYNDDGNLNKLTGPDSITWNTRNGVQWQSTDGKGRWNGTVSLQLDGVLSIYNDDIKHETTYFPDGAKRTHNRNSASEKFGEIVLERNGNVTVEQSGAQKLEEPSATLRGSTTGLAANRSGEQARPQPVFPIPSIEQFEQASQPSDTMNTSLEDALFEKAMQNIDEVPQGDGDVHWPMVTAEQQVESALHDMTSEEKVQYMRGKVLSETDRDSQSFNSTEKADHDFYATMKSTLDDAASSVAQLLQWEAVIERGASATAEDTGAGPDGAQDGWISGDYGAYDEPDHREEPAEHGDNLGSAALVNAEPFVGETHVATASSEHEQAANNNLSEGEEESLTNDAPEPEFVLPVVERLAQVSGPDLQFDSAPTETEITETESESKADTKADTKAELEPTTEPETETAAARDLLVEHGTDGSIDGQMPVTQPQPVLADGGYVKLVVWYAKQLRDLPPEHRKVFQGNIGACLDLYRQSHKSAGDALVDAWISASVLASTGGLNLSLVAGAGVLCAVLETATRVLSLDIPFDFAGADTVTGLSITDSNTLSSMLGTARIGRIVQSAETAAVGASVNTASMAGALLRENAAQQLQQELLHLLREAIAAGSSEITTEQLSAISRKVALPGMELAVGQILKQNFERTVLTEFKSLFKAILQQYATCLAADVGVDDVGVDDTVTSSIDSEPQQSVTAVGAASGLEAPSFAPLDQAGESTDGTQLELAVQHAEDVHSGDVISSSECVPSSCTETPQLEEAELADSAHDYGVEISLSGASSPESWSATTTTTGVEFVEVAEHHNVKISISGDGSPDRWPGVAPAAGDQALAGDCDVAEADALEAPHSFESAVEIGEQEPAGGCEVGKGDALEAPHSFEPAVEVGEHEPAGGCEVGKEDAAETPHSFESKVGTVGEQEPAGDCDVGKADAAKTPHSFESEVGTVGEHEPAGDCDVGKADAAEAPHSFESEVGTVGEHEPAGDCDVGKADAAETLHSFESEVDPVGEPEPTGDCDVDKTDAVETHSSESEAETVGDQEPDLTLQYDEIDQVDTAIDVSSEGRTSYDSAAELQQASLSSVNVHAPDCEEPQATVVQPDVLNRSAADSQWALMVNMGTTTPDLGSPAPLAQKAGAFVQLVSATSLWGDQPEVRLEGGDTGCRMALRMEGHVYELVRPPYANWFYDHLPSSRDQADPVKVFVRRGQNCARLLSIIVPALKNDSVLCSLVASWRTTDPRCAGELGDLQFVISGKSAENSRKIHDRLKQLLLEASVSTEENIASAQYVQPLLSRFSEYFRKESESCDGAVRVCLARALSQKILADQALTMRAAVNRRSLSEQLEIEAGIAPGLVHVGVDGVICVKLSDQARDYFSVYGDLIYVNDGNRNFGQLTDRSAIWSLYATYGAGLVDDDSHWQDSP